MRFMRLGGLLLATAAYSVSVGCSPRVAAVPGMRQAGVYGAIWDCKHEAMRIAVANGYSSLYVGIGGPIAAVAAPGVNAGTAAYRACMLGKGWRTEDRL